MDAMTVKWAHCLRRGRKLTASSSVSAGYGPTCRARVRKAVATIELPGTKDEQHAKAIELIEAGGIVPSSRPGVFFAVSSDGSTVYVADLGEGTCTCKAGQKGRACYHLPAARLIAAASVRRAA
jgi:hypothetical protein